jgi:hypothetical protein
MAAIGCRAELGASVVPGTATTATAARPLPRRRLPVLLAVVALAAFLVGRQPAPAVSPTVAHEASAPIDATVAPGPSAGRGRDDGVRRRAEAAGIDVDRTVARPAVGKDTVALEVPDEAIERATYPLTIDPVIGPEHPVDPTAVHRPTVAFDPAVASDGTNFLVAWDGPDGTRVARVDQSGALLDPSGTLVAPPPEGYEPAVAFDGTNYLVTWSTDCCDSSDIRGTRVSRAGEVLDPAGIAIASTPRNEVEPALAFDGTNYLVVWQSGGGEGDIDVAAARVAPAGNVLDPTPFAVSDPDEASGGPAITFDGTNFLVVWTSNGIKAARVSPSGSVVAPGPFAVSGTGPHALATVAFDGRSSLVAWTVFPGSTTSIYGARVSPAGAVLDPGGFPISMGLSDRIEPTATRVGARVLVAWQDGRGDGDIYAARVDQAGVVLDPAGIAVATGTAQQTAPATAAGGGPAMVTFASGSPTESPRLAGVRVSPAGAVLDPTLRPVAQTTNSQTGAKIAFDGTNFLVAWIDDRNHLDRHDVYAARLTPSGENLDPDGIRVTPAPISGGLGDLVFDGENFLVAWDGDAHRLQVARIGTDGVLRDPTPIPLSDGTGSERGVRLSSDGTNTLAVWTRFGNREDVVGTRISRSGQVLDPAGLTVAGEAGTDASPSVAFDGVNHLVVYDRTSDDGRQNHDIVARRVSPTGAVLDAVARPLVTSRETEFGSELAWGGRWYYVAWTRLTATGTRETAGTRVSREVAPLEPAERLSTGEDVSGPVVTALGGRFLVSWTRWEGSDPDVHAVQVDADGSRRDRSPFLVAGSASLSDVASGNGRWTTVYVHPLHPDHDSDRLFLRTVAPK